MPTTAKKLKNLDPLKEDINAWVESNFFRDGKPLRNKYIKRIVNLKSFLEAPYASVVLEQTALKSYQKFESDDLSFFDETYVKEFLNWQQHKLKSFLDLYVSYIYITKLLDYLDVVNSYAPENVELIQELTDDLLEAQKEKTQQLGKPEEELRSTPGLVYCYIRDREERGKKIGKEDSEHSNTTFFYAAATSAIVFVIALIGISPISSALVSFCGASLALPLAIGIIIAAIALPALVVTLIRYRDLRQEKQRFGKIWSSIVDETNRIGNSLFPFIRPLINPNTTTRVPRLSNMDEIKKSKPYRVSSPSSAMLQSDSSDSDSSDSENPFLGSGKLAITAALHGKQRESNNDETFVTESSNLSPAVSSR